jgi:hypothetical protein
VEILEGLMPTITPEQKQAVDRAGDAPVPITDPQSGASFVLLKADVYERMLAASGEEADPREGYPVVDRIMASDDVDDPYLHIYQAGS